MLALKKNVSLQGKRNLARQIWHINEPKNHDKLMLSWKHNRAYNMCKKYNLSWNSKNVSDFFMILLDSDNFVMAFWHHIWHGFVLSRFCCYDF